MNNLTLSKLNEEYKVLEDKDINCIILYIHMPTGENEVIVNSNVEEKIKYINKTYDENLIHKGCKDIYITEVIFALDEIEGMEFKEAFELMKQGYKVKLPSWSGYWYWDKKEETIMIHCKDGKTLDIRETDVVDFTFSNICSDEWIIANEDNTPILVK